MNKPVKIIYGNANRNIIEDCVYEGHPVVLKRFRDEATYTHEARLHELMDVCFPHKRGVIAMLGYRTQEMALVFPKFTVDLTKLNTTASAPRSTLTRLRIMSDIASGLELLHSLDIIHGHVKPAHILVQFDPDGKFSHAALAGFGCAKKLERETMTVSPIPVFTKPYAPPWAYTQGPFVISRKDDIYSLGIVILEQFVPTLVSVVACEQRIRERRTLAIQTELHALNRLVTDMLDLDSTRRPNAKQVKDRLKDCLTELSSLALTRQASDRSVPSPTPRPFAPSPNPAAQPGIPPRQQAPPQQPIKVIPFDEFSPGQQLGSAGTKHITTHVWKPPGSSSELVVLKWFASHQSVIFEKERRIYDLANSHPNVVGLRGTTSKDGSKALVLPRYQSSLAEKLPKRDKNVPQMSMSEKLQTFIYLARGLEFLHSWDILHGDIKPDNILLHKDGLNQLAWTDFGTSGVLDEGDTHVTRTAHGKTPAYCPPWYYKPTLENGKLSSETDTDVYLRSKPDDIYSLGIVFAEITTWTPQSMELNIRRANCVYVDPISTASLNLTTLIQRMLQLDRKLRPKIGDIVVSLVKCLDDFPEVSALVRAEIDAHGREHEAAKTAGSLRRLAPT